MNTRFLTALAIGAALLLTGQPTFAKDHKGGGKGGKAVASAHHSGGGGASKARIASTHFKGGGKSQAFASKGGGKQRFQTARVARNNTPANVSANQQFARANTKFNRNNTTFAQNSTRANFRGTGGRRPSVAFGGNNYNYRGGGGARQYAFASHSGWSHDRDYDWRGRHYRWIDNAWFTIDTGPDVEYYAPGYYRPAADSLSIQVQQDLMHDGYYDGPVDGLVGPGTRSAIAAYQRDNGLPVTGQIDRPLMQSLNVW